MLNTLKLSRSGYYKSKQNKLGKREQEEQQLAKEIKKIHQESREKYGSPKIHAKMVDSGHKISRQRTKKIMDTYGLERKVGRKFKVTTNSKHGEIWSPNLLVRDFSAPQPNAVWVSDITYIDTREGWMYLCVIIDLFSNYVAGWALRPHMKEDLVIEALDMAHKRRRPPRLLVFHSDGGGQYVGKRFRARLKRYGMIQSMSRKGDPWDNAVAESFFSQFKNEQIHPYVFLTRQHLDDAVFSYLEVFYNRKRIQQKTEWLSPEEFERNWRFTKLAKKSVH